MAGFDINIVTLSGGLTADPELRALPSGTSLCKMRLAFKERFKNGATGEWEDRSNYVDLTSWGGLGEWHANNLSRGSQVVVSGRLRWREYESDGKKLSAYEIVVESLIPRESGGGGGGNRQSRQAEDFAARDSGGFTPREAAPTGGPAADDDIPF